jgi:uncharacterized protein YqjF (DUF2071 family)
VSGRTPDTQVRFPVLRQAWRTVAFVHFAYDPAVVQRLLPAPLVVDTYEGEAWVTITPLVMADLRPAPLPAAVSIPSFPETNLRTYVRTPNGRDGLWFFSLDVTSPTFTAAARAMLGAPYLVADLTVDYGANAQPESDGEAGRVIRYRGSRGTDAAYDIAVRPGDPMEASALDDWLTGRWRAYTRHGGALLETPVAHEPWPLLAAQVVTCEESLTVAAGLPAPEGVRLTHYSEGVEDVRFGVTHPVG